MDQPETPPNVDVAPEDGFITPADQTGETAAATMGISKMMNEPNESSDDDDTENEDEWLLKKRLEMLTALIQENGPFNNNWVSVMNYLSMCPLSDIVARGSALH